jgi:MFS family permease
VSAAPASTSLSRRIGLYSGGFIGPFGGGMVIVLVPEFRDVFGVSTATASLVLPFYLVPFALFQLVSGTVGERLGRDQVLRVAFFVYAVGSMMGAITGSFVPFLIARAIQGSANAFVTPIALAKLADATPEEELGKAVGTFASVQTAGTVMAPLIGGVAGAIDYRLAFVAAALASLVLMVIVPEKKPKPNPELVPSLRSALTPRARWLCVSGVSFFICTIGLAVIVSLAAADRLGVGASARGLLLAGFGFSGVIAGRPSGDLLDRIGVERILRISVILTAVLIGSVALANDPWSLAILWFLAGGASAMVATTLNTIIVGASTRNRGGAISIVGSSRFVGAAIAPVIWIPVYNANPHLAYVLAGIGMGIVLFAASRAIHASAGPPALEARPTTAVEAL